MGLPAAVDPRLRSVLVALAASVLAIWVGVAIAQEEHFLAFLTAALSTWLLVAWVGGPLAEAWLVAFLVFGYVVGNRGFAQVAPAGNLPLFFGELGLAGATALLLIRHALLRRLPVTGDLLNGTLLLWIAIGCGRILFDAREYGLVALRDFATIYYAAFFFIAQALNRHRDSNRLLLATLTGTFALLPVTSLLSDLLPDFFSRHLVVKGVPLIYYKGDLLATFLIAGFFLLLPAGAWNWREHGWRWAAALVSLGYGIALVSRAGMAGLAVALGWCALARRWRPVVATAAVCAAGLVGTTTVSLVRGEDFTQTRAYAVIEHLQSMADFSGTGAYQSPDAADSGDNNRFRLVWWRTIVEETMAGGPLLGLGFGHDIARGFVQEYYPLMEGEFTARSPHSVLFTIFGRMGAVGLASWLAFLAVLAAVTQRQVAAARRAGGQPPGAAGDRFTLLLLSWVILISACFGVVLEGPMGAIPFWVILGLAHGPEPGSAATAEPVPASVERTPLAATAA